MNIYFSGIGGVGLGPLAEIARDAGHIVHGSDAQESLTTRELQERGIPVSTDQTGDYLMYCHRQQSIDWFVYTAGLPNDHPELLKARELGLHLAKRDELINYIIGEKRLNLIAVAGTHGKTTTTAMMVWVFRQLDIPVSFSIGATTSFAPAGHFDPNSRYFVYECDEFDYNFLHFEPDISIITSLDYDHPDTYPTEGDYRAAFERFLTQSKQTVMWLRDTFSGLQTPKNAWLLKDSEVMPLRLAGAHNRANATLIAKACEYLKLGQQHAVLAALSSFPGTSRRFEKLAENLYSDYGHHPVEIAATLQMARELSDRVVLVYQPHQNVRQHEIRDQYDGCMELAEEIYWLPTYLTREDPRLPILTPQELASNLTNRNAVHYAELNDELWQHIETARRDGKLVLCMGAGTIDGWLREQLAKANTTEKFDNANDAPTA